MDDSVHFGWLKHDGRSYGEQRIVDSVHQTEVGIEFFKRWATNDRESWLVNVKASPTSMKQKKLQLFFYFAYDGESQMNITKIENDEFSGFTAWTPELGHFALAVKKGSQLKPHMINFNIEPSRVWMIHEHIGQRLRHNLQNAYMSVGQSLFEYTDLSSFAKLKSEGPLNGANTVVFQFFIAGETGYSFLFAPLKDSNSEAALSELSKQAEALMRGQTAAADALLARLHETFSIPKQFEQFASYALANLLGGISYFYGDSVVQKKGESGTSQRAPPSVLFTDVPARPNFPRGFYWDSGFHNILLAKWDVHLSMEILSHWMSKIDEDGWVGREQILGDEARSRVPKEFIPQNTEYSNPPAPILPLLMITKQVFQQANDSDARLLFRPTLMEIYEKMKRHFGWFLANQRATLLDEDDDDSDLQQPFLFRWRGRNKHHTLTSGLDDYPRGNVPSKYELHVDLLSWMALMARSLDEMAKILEVDESDYDYSRLLAEAKENLIKFHWDDDRGCFADCTVNEAGDALVFVPNTGYVSLFPMLFGLLDQDDPKLGRLFDILEDSEQLWTE